MKTKLMRQNKAVKEKEELKSSRSRSSKAQVV